MPSTPRDFTIVCPRAPLPISRTGLAVMTTALAKKRRVLWDYHGLVQEIPPEVIANLIELAHDLEGRTAAPNLDTPPPLALTVLWEQTRTFTPRPPDDEDAARDPSTRPEPPTPS